METENLETEAAFGSAQSGSINPSLEHKIENTKERTLTEQEFFEVMRHAQYLQEYDLLKEQKKEEILASLTSLSLPQVDQGIPISALYRVARDQNIPEKYIQRALDTRHPSAEVQLEDIRKIGAIPTTQQCLRKVFKEYERGLANAIFAAYPQEIIKFKTNEDTYDSKDLCIFQLKETGKKPWQFWRKKFIQEPWARLGFYTYHSGIIPKQSIIIYIDNARFLRACGDTLERLKEKLKEDLYKEPVISYDYDTE